MGVRPALHATSPRVYRRSRRAAAKCSGLGRSLGTLIRRRRDGPHRTLSWGIQFGTGTSSKARFNCATPTAQQAKARQAKATDLDTLITIANGLRAALVVISLSQGGP